MNQQNQQARFIAIGHGTWAACDATINGNTHRYSDAAPCRVGDGSRTVSLGRSDAAADGTARYVLNIEGMTLEPGTRMVIDTSPRHGEAPIRVEHDGPGLPRVEFLKLELRREERA
jgi:hypothetical protein